MNCSFLFRPQMPDDFPAVDALHEESFGPGRFARTAHRIREAARVPPAIALTAWDGAQLIGAIQFTAITIGGRAGAALLGPLAIAPAYKNKGCGLRLMQDGLAEAKRLGFELVVLIGDLPYYRRAGFNIIPHGRIALPGPADPARFLAAELTPRALSRFSGMVAPDNGAPTGGDIDPSRSLDCGAPCPQPLVEIPQHTTFSDADFVPDRKDGDTVLVQNCIGFTGKSDP